MSVLAACGSGFYHSSNRKLCLHSALCLASCLCYWWKSYQGPDKIWRTANLVTLCRIFRCLVCGPLWSRVTDEGHHLQIPNRGIPLQGGGLTHLGEGLRSSPSEGAVVKENSLLDFLQGGYNIYIGRCGISNFNVSVISIVHIKQAGPNIFLMEGRN